MCALSGLNEACYLVEHLPTSRTTPTPSFHPFQVFYLASVWPVASRGQHAFALAAANLIFPARFSSQINYSFSSWICWFSVFVVFGLDSVFVGFSRGCFVFWPFVSRCVVLSMSLWNNFDLLCFFMGFHMCFSTWNTCKSHIYFLNYFLCRVI